MVQWQSYLFAKQILPTLLILNYNVSGINAKYQTQATIMEV